LRPAGHISLQSRVGHSFVRTRRRSPVRSANDSVLSAIAGAAWAAVVSRMQPLEHIDHKEAAIRPVERLRAWNDSYRICEERPLRASAAV
jgi:hypothetical protein